MILTVGNTKGGVGKTTLAVNIAIARSLVGSSDVLLIDGDEQKTALTFTELRSSQLGTTGYTAVSLSGAALRTQVRQLAPKYTDIVIDVGGRDLTLIRIFLNSKKKSEAMGCKSVAPFLPPKFSFFEGSSL